MSEGTSNWSEMEQSLSIAPPSDLMCFHTGRATVRDGLAMLHELDHLLDMERLEERRRIAEVIRQKAREQRFRVREVLLLELVDKIERGKR